MITWQMLHFLWQDKETSALRLQRAIFLSLTHWSLSSSGDWQALFVYPLLSQTGLPQLVHKHLKVHAFS